MLLAIVTLMFHFPLLHIGITRKGLLTPSMRISERPGHHLGYSSGFTHHLNIPHFFTIHSVLFNQYKILGVSLKRLHADKYAFNS